MFDKEILVFDGAIGTELYERGFYINRPFEELNLTAAQEVRAVHLSYLEAGAQVITTNSFSIPKPQLKKFDIEGKQRELLIAAVHLASDARKNFSAKVSVSLGPTGQLIEPLGPMSREEVITEYREIAAILKEVEDQFDFINLETFTNLDELNCAIDGLRSILDKKPILACISPKFGNVKFLHDFASEVAQRKDVQAIGLNCSDGPSEILSQLKILSQITQKYIVVQPNAGIPRQLNGRYFYMSSPDYLAKFAKRYVEAGASGIGGCCGTGPIHIKAIANALKVAEARNRVEKIEGIFVNTQKTKSERLTLESRSESNLSVALKNKEKIYTIEMTSPKGVNLEKFYQDLNLICNAGIKFVNVPDGARASTRVGSLHLAAKVNRDFKGRLSVLPHFTTRDRNLIGLQADLIGAWLNEVREVLLITGDPPKLGNNKDATGVFDIDSIGLTHLADSLNRGNSPNGDDLGSHTGFCIGVASNPTASNLEGEIQRWKYKYEMGADFAVTQPIYSAQSFFEWKNKISHYYLPHIVGIWPFVSLRNAEFMANEVPGVHVPKWVLEEMSRAGDNKTEAVKRGIEISLKVMNELQNECEGFAVSAPLGKSEVAIELYKNFGVGHT